MSNPELTAEAYPIYFHIAEVFGGQVVMEEALAIACVYTRGQLLSVEPTARGAAFVHNHTTHKDSPPFNPNAADACFVAADRAAKLLPKLPRYTLADIKRIHEDGGGRFFSRENMRFAGDTLRSFKVRNMPDGSVWMERVRPRRDSSGRSMGGVGELHRVNLETGDIAGPREG